MPNSKGTSYEWWDPILPTTKAKGEHVVAAAAKAGHHITRCYGYQTTYEHNTKRCVDFMTYNDRAMGDWIAAYLKRNADKLGVIGIIWRGRNMGFPENGSEYAGPSGVWRTRQKADHYDHVHVMFDAHPISKPKPAAKTKGKRFTVRKGPKRGRSYIWPGTIDSGRLNECARKGWFSKHIWATQHFLNRIGYRSGHSTGYWSKSDQAAYDKFRRDQGYKGADARGTVGPESLGKLVNRAGSKRKVK